MRIKLCGLIACAAMLAAGVVSCQQHDDIPQGVKYPILFDSPDTRATATIDDLKDNGFMVYAFVDGNVNDITFNKAVKYHETLKVWAFETPEYWIPYTNYTFKAFYPSPFTAGKLNVDTAKKDLNFTITEFDVVNHQEDILVASATADVPEGKSYPDDRSIVDLNFQHLLACIDIKIKSAINGVTISKITIQDAETNGTYSSATGLWNSSAYGNIEANSNVKLEVGKDYVAVTHDGILVIPASAEGKILIIETQNGGTTKSYSVEFPDDNKWEKGKKYTYTVEIKQDNIVFNEPDVDEWDSENATGSVIIK
jgi:hypothetical protein